LGQTDQGRWSREAERVGEAQVADLKLQAGNIDPGRDAPKGAAGPGERKAVARIRSRTGLICGEPVGDEAVVSENGYWGADRRIARTS
jgi:hypothetical protein